MGKVCSRKDAVLVAGGGEACGQDRAKWGTCLVAHAFPAVGIAVVTEALGNL